MKTESSKLIHFWLIGFLFIGTEYFHFIKLSFDSRDILLIFSTVILGIYALICSGDFKRVSYNNTIAIFPLLMCIVASIIPMIIFHQSFWAGFLAQRHFFLTFLCYYPIRLAFAREELTFDYVKKTVNIFASIELLIVFLQCLLRNKIIFTSLTFSSFVKYGASTGRLGFNGPIIIFAICFWINDFFNNKKKFLNLSKVLISLYVFFTFSQTRMMMIGLSVTVIVAMLISKGSLLKKILTIITLMLIIYLFIRSNYWITMTSALNGSLVNTKYDTTSIRKYGRELYISGFLKSGLIGMGYPHESCSAAYEAAGFYDNVLLVDNGFFGFVYVYGILGIFFYCKAYISNFIKAIYLYRLNYRMCYILYFTYFITVSLSMMHFYLYEVYGFELLLVVCMLEKDSLNFHLKILN